MMKTLENLKAALEQEEAAIANYLCCAEETDDLQIQEMFRQFAKNESWPYLGSHGENHPI